MEWEERPDAVEAASRSSSWSRLPFRPSRLRMVSSEIHGAGSALPVRSGKLFQEFAQWPHGTR